MAFLPLGNFDHLVSVSINFPMGWSLWFPREDIFKLSGTSAEASKFCELLQVGIDVLIPHHKYQVKLDLSQWFPAACAAAIVHRFFVCLYQQNKSSECKKLSWDKIVIIAKGFLKHPNFHMLIKLKSPSIPRNLALKTSVELPIVFSTKVNLLYLLYSMAICIAIVCKPGCDIMNFEVSFIFLIKPFFLHD